MAPNESPKSLNSLNEHKLTRRRVMKAAAAVGMSSAAALSMTPEDVKAADSDQVTIPFDTEGEVKKQIAADKLDWYYRARDATEHIRQAHFHKDAVHRVSTVGGGPGGDNAHVKVVLDDSQGNADERRGEIPEEKNGVRVETETDDDGGEVNDHCSPQCWTDKSAFPGGQKIHDLGGGDGTISPQMYDGGLDWFGWTTAAHVLDDCYTGQIVEHNPSSCSNYDVGTVSKIDKKRDLAFIEATYDVTQDEHYEHPEGSERVEILGTLSEEGFVTINDAGQPHFVYGIGGCKTTMNLEEWNGSHTQSGGCSSSRVDQMYSGGSALGGTSDGDSGALYAVEDPNNAGNYYAMGSHSGKDYIGLDLNNYGVQGFTINKVYDRRWDN